MPYVNIKVTREGTSPDSQGVTPEQKAELIKGVSELLLKVLNKPMDCDLRRHQRGRQGRLGRRRPAGRGVAPDRMRPSVSRSKGGR